MQAQLCQAAFAQCQQANAGDSEAQSTLCIDGIQSKCGTLDIADFEDSNDDDDAKTTTTTATSAAQPTSTSSTSNNDSDDSGVMSMPIFATGSLAVVMAALFAQVL